MIHRQLSKNDYYSNFFDVLSQLTQVDKHLITYDDFTEYVNNLDENHQIIVFEDNNKILATGTLLIEKKIIHGLGKVGHIEDVVVDENARGLGLGKKIIDILKTIAIEKKCYKVILECNDNNVAFYEKSGFVKYGNSMKFITQP